MTSATMIPRERLSLWAKQVLAFLAALLLAPATAAQVSIHSSTPDIRIDSTATADIAVPGGVGATWLYVKNDCQSVIYFDLNRPAGGRDASNAYPIRLGTGETFSGAFRLGTVIGASHGATKETETTQCTVTVVFGR